MSDALHTLSQHFVKARQTNTTDTSFPSRIPQADAPSGKGNSAAQATASAVFDLVSAFNVEGETAKNVIKILPFGAGANDTTFSMRVIGWRKCYDRSAAKNEETALWIPEVLGEFACTISSTPIGLAGKVVVATDLFADTITLVGTTANDDIDISIRSPVNDTIGRIVIDLEGSQKVEITFDMTGATNANALVAMY